MKILMAVTSDLVNDQRVHRSCSALTEAGHEVVLIGRRLPDSLPLQRDYRTLRMRLLFRRSALFYAEYNIRLLLRLLFLKCDLIFSNDTDTLPACYVASVFKRVPHVHDAHELFCEVPELVDRPRVQHFWQRIEDRIMPHLAAAFTVCQPIAQIYHDRYGVDFHVVRNVPMQISDGAIHIASDPHPHPILLYQGAVNKGRGVDWMIEAMQYLPECEFHIVGKGDELEAMRRLAASKPYADRIVFHGSLPPEQLRQLTPQADLGISLLADLGKNYYYSLPNRIADFVQARVPVLATDFPEIRNVVECYRIGTLLEGHDPLAIADAVRSTLAHWQTLSPEQRSAIFDPAAADLSWDHDKKVLIATINAILSTSTR